MEIRMQSEKLIGELPKGLLKWYEFHKGGSALLVTAGARADVSLAEVLLESGLEIDTLDVSELESAVLREKKRNNYDYIVAVGALEWCGQPEIVLQMLKKKLRPSGRLILGMDNRLGIRYFCGEKDPFTLRLYDGIDNYSKVGSKESGIIRGRNYSMTEIKDVLRASGFENYKFYSVFPELQRPQIFLAEDYTPNEALGIRIFPQYSSPETVFLEEERLYDILVKEGMLHAMANGYFIECPLSGAPLDADQITVSIDRGAKNSLATIIKSGKSVVKKALYHEGQEKIRMLLENTEYLKKHHVPMADAEIRSGHFWMPYIDGEIATVYFQKLLKKDKKEFLLELAHFFDIILGSSEAVPYSEVNWEHFEPGWENRKKDDPNLDKWRQIALCDKHGKENVGIILKRGYIDMVSLNCFYSKGGFVFFDQEFYIENLPANAIMIRTIDCIYGGQNSFNEILPVDEVLKYFHIYKYRDTWRRYGGLFIRSLRKENELASYHKEHRSDLRVINANRMRMNFSQEEYEKLFCDIFRNISGKKVYLFGSGAFARRFLERFGSEIKIAGIWDNNEERWGERLDMIEIQRPRAEVATNTSCKVIICVKRYETILKQLKNMGIKDISIYSPDIDYPLPLKISTDEKEKENKKYNIGYIAGVFDMFHIGHLNLFKRAKQQCNYLIVGIVSDEQVIQNKKTAPYISFFDRMEIVKACKYVDKVVKIPINHSDTEDAFRTYRFDVQFSGSDYENDPEWLAKRTYLQQHGADMVFFPYTESISTSKLKERIKIN